MKTKQYVFYINYQKIEQLRLKNIHRTFSIRFYYSDYDFDSMKKWWFCRPTPASPPYSLTYIMWAKQFRGQSWIILKSLPSVLSSCSRVSSNWIRVHLYWSESETDIAFRWVHKTLSSDKDRRKKFDFAFAFSQYKCALRFIYNRAKVKTRVTSLSFLY